MRTILVIEDEPLVAADLSETLGELGYHVLGTARTAAAALAVCAHHSPDVVLVDIRLDGPTDGVAAVTSILERQRPAVVYLTAHSDEVTVARAKATAPHGYLLKPFTTAALRTTLEVAIYRRELEDAIETRTQRLDASARPMAEHRRVGADRLGSSFALARGAARAITDPITAVIANNELLRTRLRDASHSLGERPLAGPAAAEQFRVLADAASDALAAAERVASVAAALGSWGRIERAPISVVDLPAAIDAAVRRVGTLLTDHAPLVRALDVTPPIEVDEMGLVHALAALLTNAAEAIPPSRRAVSQIRIATGTDGPGRVFVSIEDTGVGMAPATQERIFDPFFTTKRLRDGIGLGLSMALAFAVAAGGTISVDSALDRGSLFRLVLPTARARLAS